MDLALWPYNPREVNVDSHGELPAPYNLQDGFDAPWPIWSITILPPDVQLAVGVYKADKKIDTFHVTIPKRHQRGHPEHSAYILERDRTIDLELSETEEDGKGTKRPRQSSETPDNTIDTMEG